MIGNGTVGGAVSAEGAVTGGVDVRVAVIVEVQVAVIVSSASVIRAAVIVNNASVIMAALIVRAASGILAHHRGCAEALGLENIDCRAAKLVF